MSPGPGPNDNENPGASGMVSVPPPRRRRDTELVIGIEMAAARLGIPTVLFSPATVTMS